MKDTGELLFATVRKMTLPTGLGLGSTTLDEPIKETLLRDLRQIAEKLRVVLLPLKEDGESSQSGNTVINKLRECM